MPQRSRLSLRSPRPGGQLLSRHWELAALGCWTVLWFAIKAPGGGIAWKFFVQGSLLMFTGHDGASAHPGGLHIYANYPQLQIGPLAFSAAQVVRHLGPDQGLFLAELIMTAMGLYAVYVIRRFTLTIRPELAAGRATRWTFLSGGAAFMIVWVQLAVAFGHLDDALALLCALLAAWASVTGRPVVTGLLVGAAADAKPWALIFLPILLLSGVARPDSGGRPGVGTWAGLRHLADLRRRPGLRRLALAAVSAVAVITAGWLPFFIADPGTITAAHYTITNLPDSALRALGVHTPRTPSWDRPAQVAAGCVLGVLAIWRGRWLAVILLAVGARIALDPAAHAYYSAGVLIGALLWDMVGTRSPVPLWSLSSLVALTVTPLLTPDVAAWGIVRLALVVAFTLAILAGPSRWYWQSAADLNDQRSGDQGIALTRPPDRRRATRGAA